VSTQSDGQFTPEAIRVARGLRDQIIDGTRAPGSRLVEREIGEEMGVSRVPVRDALKILISEGLAVPRPFSWALVWEATERDIDDLIEVRSAIETLSFSLAAKHATADGLRALAADLARERTAAAGSDALGARRAAADFHATVTSLAGNGLLAEMFRVTDGRMRWLLAQHDDLGEMLEEHDALYQAIQTGDAKLAARLAQRHVRASRKTALKRLARQG
jgi:DNA-binding GntR family transcriptional regulator